MPFRPLAVVAQSVPRRNQPSVQPAVLAGNMFVGEISMFRAQRRAPCAVAAPNSYGRLAMPSSAAKVHGARQPPNVQTLPEPKKVRRINVMFWRQAVKTYSVNLAWYVWRMRHQRKGTKAVACTVARSYQRYCSQQAPQRCNISSSAVQYSVTNNCPGSARTVARIPFANAIPSLFRNVQTAATSHREIANQRFTRACR